MLRTSQSPTLKRRTSLQGKREFKIGMIIDRSNLPGISTSDPVHGKDIPLPPPPRQPPGMRGDPLGATLFTSRNTDCS
jgi:hypothetical protein